MYAWIALGLLVTTTATWLAHRMGILGYIGLDGLLTIIGVTIAFVLFLSFVVRRVPVLVGASLYCVCAVLVGVSVSIIFGIYTTEAIVLPFAMIAGLFALMSASGFVSRRDLSKWWMLVLFGLLGLVVNNLVNRYIFSTWLFELITIVALLLCLSLACWQTRRAKTAAQVASLAGDTTTTGRIAVIGAVQFYVTLLGIPFYSFGAEGCSPS